jgi:hypothetical protein
MDENSKRNRTKKEKIYIFYRKKFNYEFVPVPRRGVTHTVPLILKLRNVESCGHFLAVAASLPGKEVPVCTQFFNRQLSASQRQSGGFEQETEVFYSAGN